MSKATLNWLGDVFLYGGLPAVVLFAFFYGLRSQWWRYVEGRALLAAKLSITGITLFIVLALSFDDFTGRSVVRLIAYALFFVAEWWFTITLLVSQHRSRARARVLADELKAAERREGVD